jgi:hypothetical protein
VSSLQDAIAARRRTGAVRGLRSLAQARSAAPGSGGGVAATAPGRSIQAAGASSGEEHCEVCGVGIAPEHRHLLHITERRIVCACEPCWAMRAGEGDLRPCGSRIISLTDIDLPDELWAELQIPIGLAFLMRSSVTDCVVAMYPSPAGATESELRFDSWQRLCARNPQLAALEEDIEGLIVNRLADPPAYVIAPIDRCYELTGTIKASWEGISGGPGVELAVAAFFNRLGAEMAA